MIIDNIKELGETIRKHRKLQGVTQQQLAALAGVSPRLVSELERGKTTTEIGRAFRVVLSIGLTIDIKENT